MSELPLAHLHRGLALLAERAAWHAPTRTLFVADVHLGKAATYRALGQPAPIGTTRENLHRLTALIESRRAARMVFLGDLFHAQRFHTSAAGLFLEWRKRHREIECVLVRGNHDLRAGDGARELEIEAANEPHACGAFEARHHPLPEIDAMGEEGQTILAGHVHPTVRLHGPGRDSMRCPCFVLQGRQIILPAFGEFTGGAQLAWSPTMSFCAITEAGLIIRDGARRQTADGDEARA